jgi:hypothetical protein
LWTARTVPPGSGPPYVSPVRNRYLDILRASAIVLVFVQTVLVRYVAGWPPEIALPALGLLFALAGSLTAASLGRHGGATVVIARLRRLLPPLWLLGLVTVPVMLVAGWRHETGGEHPFHLATLAYWLLPVIAPPGSDAGSAVWEPLWFLRTYVWLLLLSPFLHAAYRRAGWYLIAAAIALAALPTPGFLTDLTAFAGCWIAGFAVQDGRLARLRPWLAGPVAVLLAAGAVLYHPLLPVAAIPFLLYRQPRPARPGAVVTLLNARALTVYLWYGVALSVAAPALAIVSGRQHRTADLALGLALTVLAVLLFGWAEDLSAGRAPRLWPAGPDALRREDPIVPPPAPILNPTRSARPDARAYSAAAAMTRMPTSWQPPAPRTAEPFTGRHTAPTVPPAGRHAASPPPANRPAGEIAASEIATGEILPPSRRLPAPRDGSL